MAALTITAANVALVSGTPLADQEAGEAFIAGNAVYKDANGKLKKLQGDGTTIEAGENGIFIALFTADAAGARGSVAKRDCVVSFGAILTTGLIYIGGDTAGAIYPSADAGSGDKVPIIGQAISTSQMKLFCDYAAGAQIA